MGTEDQKILTVNAGSSSIKLDIFFVDATSNDVNRLLELSITGIGQTSAKLIIQQKSKDTQTQEIAVEDHATATEIMTNLLYESGSMHNIVGIGHRIVHGGPKYSKPTHINEEFINYLESYTNFDPEHIPAALKLIRAFQQRIPNVPQIACFDTAFFHNLPRVAQLLTFPSKYQSEGLRRYGFHGLSYTSLGSSFRELAGEDTANGRVVYAHLGSGASLAAVHKGNPVDTTMSFTPASGIIMSTRSGDVDPGISWYLQQEHGVGPEEYKKMVNFESGLLGVSGLSADMYTLIQSEETNTHAADAVELFVYQVKKTIGSFSAVLGGLDSLVFSGGIGEQSSILRKRICDGLEYLSIEIDQVRNDHHETLISSDNSGIGVHVLQTNEAKVIFEQVMGIIKTNSGGEN